jgi:hypothetical protein
MMRVRTAVPWGLIALAALSFTGRRSTGQTQHTGQQFADSASSTSTADLPDSPGTVLANSDTAHVHTSENAPSLLVRNIQNTTVMRLARKNHRVVRPFEQAQPLSGGDKIELSVMSRLTPGEAFATVFGAGWSQLRNSHPNYGTNGEAFEKRLGALAIKGTSQSFFSYGVYAAAFHDDPRYYIMGPTIPVRRRVVYSATRTIITQKDDGSRAINWPKLAGIATATALTTAYYPKVDHGFGNETKAFVASVGTSMLTDELHEFIGDAMRMVHRNN